MRKAFFLIAAVALFSLAAGQCQISEMTPAETSQWLKNIFGFVAEELNGLREDALKRNVPGQVQQVTVYAGAPEAWSVREIAGLTNTDPLALARELGVYPGKRATKTDAERTGKKEGEVLSEEDVLDYKLTRAQVLDIANRRPGTAGVLNKLLGVAPGPEKEVSPHENMKVRMPGEQKDIPLSAIMNLPEINSSDCFLSSSHVAGRLEFIALLDKDLRLGSKYSAAKAAGQHISYSRAMASIGPYDSSIVIPAQFERYVIAIGNVAAVDMAFTIVASLYTAFDVASAKAQVARSKEAVSKVTMVSPTGAQEWPVVAPAYEHLLDGTVTYQGKTYTAKDLKEAFWRGDVDVSTFRKLTSEFKLTVPPDKVKEAQEAVDKAAKAIERQRFEDTINAYTAEIVDMEYMSQKLQQRLITTFAFGLAWLGPARFALNLANSLLLESTAAEKDQYFDLYINNKEVLSKFRKSTDFMGLGGVVDLASDVLAKGVPTKVYETKEVFLVNRPTGDRDKPVEASTGLTQEGGRWKISFGWEKDSEAEGVFFEDIRGLGDYTSIAFSSKNKRIDLVTSRQKLLAQTYYALQLVAPAMNFLLYGREMLPASALGLGQLMIYNFIVSHFIDPENYNPNEVCKKEIVDQYIYEYEFLVGAGVAETILLYPGGPTVKLAEYLVKKGLTSLGDFFKALTGKIVEAGWGSLGSKLSRAVLILDPIQLAKQLYATRGQRYVSYCKDNEYKVVAWQKLSAEKKKGLTETIQQTGIEQLTKGLNIGQALSGLGQQVKAAQLSDVLSFRSFYYDPSGQLDAQKLYYLHLDGATREWHTVLGQVKACFKTNLQSKDGTTVFTLDENGDRKSVV